MVKLFDVYLTSLSEALLQFPFGLTTSNEHVVKLVVRALNVCKYKDLTSNSG